MGSVVMHAAACIPETALCCLKAFGLYGIDSEPPMDSSYEYEGTIVTCAVSGVMRLAFAFLLSFFFKRYVTRVVTNLPYFHTWIYKQHIVVFDEPTVLLNVGT